jgi:hypothetical protein
MFTIGTISTMSQETARSPFEAQGMQPQALSNEILKLKIDDLFQEIETLKRRMERLEGQPTRTRENRPGGSNHAEGVVSDPDHRA